MSEFYVPSMRLSYVNRPIKQWYPGELGSYWTQKDNYVLHQWFHHVDNESLGEWRDIEIRKESK